MASGGLLVSMRTRTKYLAVVAAVAMVLVRTFVVRKIVHRHEVASCSYQKMKIYDPNVIGVFFIFFRLMICSILPLSKEVKKMKMKMMSCLRYCFKLGCI